VLDPFLPYVFLVVIRRCLSGALSRVADGRKGGLLAFRKKIAGNRT